MERYTAESKDGHSVLYNYVTEKIVVLKTKQKSVLMTDAPQTYLARSMQSSVRVADELKYSLLAASTSSTLFL